MLGIHLEGPFISPRRAGAHNPAWIATPDPAAVETLIEAGSGIVRLVTMAPELDGAMAAIKQLTAAGILVSVGHSDATAQQVSGAAMCGATMVTHLFNAQRPMHHREPGVVGQALADNRLTSSLIADLHHVTGQVTAIAFAAAPGRICLVTDAAACAGMPPGTYMLGGEPIELPGGDGAPPVRADGTFAGFGSPDGLRRREHGSHRHRARRRGGRGHQNPGRSDRPPRLGPDRAGNNSRPYLAERRLAHGRDLGRRQTGLRPPLHLAPLIGPPNQPS